MVYLILLGRKHNLTKFRGKGSTVKYWGQWFTQFTPFSTRIAFLIDATT